MKKPIPGTKPAPAAVVVNGSRIQVYSEGALLQVAKMAFEAGFARGMSASNIPEEWRSDPLYLAMQQDGVKRALEEYKEQK